MRGAGRARLAMCQWPSVLVSRGGAIALRLLQTSVPWMQWAVYFVFVFQHLKKNAAPVICIRILARCELPYSGPEFSM